MCRSVFFEDCLLHHRFQKLPGQYTVISVFDDPIAASFAHGFKVCGVQRSALIVPIAIGRRSEFGFLPTANFSLFFVLCFLFFVFCFLFFVLCFLFFVLGSGFRIWIVFIKELPLPHRFQKLPG
ncbi:MAG TPA: hypothetical protein ENN08_03440, partial [Bacteroidales bacterium]|nr:hypothetical protein [Bacteroidales bacterium]